MNVVLRLVARVRVRVHNVAVRGAQIRNFDPELRGLIYEDMVSASTAFHALS